MARINYADKAARTRERYLYPEEERASKADLIVPALEFALFFSPMGRGVQRGLGRFFKGRGQAIRRGLGKMSGAGAKASGKKIVEGLTSKASAFSERVTSGKLTEGIASRWNSRSANLSREVFSRKMIRGARKLGRSFMGYATNPESYAAETRFFNAVARNTGKVAIGAAAFGGLMAMAPREKKQPIADIGSGYPAGTTWVKRDRKNIRPGHLGATGDLVFALRDGR